MKICHSLVRSAIFKLLLVSIFLCPLRPALALDMTPELLFRQMEERTEQIFSLVVDLEVTSGFSGPKVRLSIQNPDKFSMDFGNGTMRIVFDGECLWIYLKALSEVLTLDTANSGGWFGNALRTWVNPRAIVANVTRRTLMSLFDISIIQPDKSSVPLPADMRKNIFLLRFIPRSSGFMKRVFQVGFYEMTFSRTTFLPTLVRDFSPSGKLRGSLKVTSYTINEEIPKERFVYTLQPGVTRIPISVVLAAKLKEVKEHFVKKSGKLWDTLTRKLMNWGQ